MLSQVLPARQCDEPTGVRGMTGPAGTSPIGLTAGGDGCRLEAGLKAQPGWRRWNSTTRVAESWRNPAGLVQPRPRAPELFTAGWRLSFAWRFSRAVCR